MRKSLAVVLFGGGLLMGYAGQLVPVRAQYQQAEFVAFNMGQTVRLQVDLPESSRGAK